MTETVEAPSHLLTLITRVKEDEEKFGFAVKEDLIDIAQYLLSWRGKFSGQEYSEAIKTLAKYHLAKLANLSPRRRIMTWRLINRELAKPYKARCRRCGLPLSNPVSLEAGHGPVCRRKLGITKKPAQEENTSFTGGSPR
jgi:hypothetical protein